MAGCSGLLVLCKRNRSAGQRLSRRVRTNMVYLFIIALFVNVVNVVRTLHDRGSLP